MSAFSRSRLAARIQNMVSKRRMEVGLYQEIVDQLQLADGGRLLEVGTGSGLQLKVIHESWPNIELYGLDISQHSIRVARKNLKHIPTDLRVGSIEKTAYGDNTFDFVMCNASMSYWENPIECFNEIYRILKPGSSARLFEPRANVDLDAMAKTIHENLAGESRIRQFAAVSINKFGLRHGNRLGMKLYSLDEIQEIASRSRFGRHALVEETILQRLPIFMRITLTKLNTE